jgi:hypothetical protein
MGWFKKFTKVFKRATVAVATGGTSELLRLAVPKSKPLFNQLGNALAPTTFKQVLQTGSAIYQPTSALSYLKPQGAQPMAFNTSAFLGSLGGIVGGLGGGSNPYAGLIQTGLQVGSALTTRAPARPGVPAVRPPSGSAGTAVAIAAATSKGLTKEIFTAGQKVLGRLGIPYRATPGAFAHSLKRALGSIASLARRVPNGTMVSILVGLGVSAMEAYVLTAWYSQKKKTRRMNPANSRALRRAARRIKGFHKLCQHTDIIKTHRRSAPAFGRKCGTCRKSPCGC